MSQYYSTPSYTAPATPVPATTPAVPVTPVEPVEPATTPTTTTTTQPSTEIPQSLQKLFKKNDRHFDGTTLTQKTSPTENSLREQQTSTLFQRQGMSSVSQEAEGYFKFLESRGVSFGVFAEEPAYAANFTNSKGDRGSYPQGQTARYHFVQMMTPGFSLHNFQTPLSNESIVSAHKELTLEKVKAMRATYEANKNIRPFLFPIEVREGILTNEEVAKLISFGGEFYAYVNKTKPLIIRDNKKYSASTSRSIPLRRDGSSVPFVSSVQPASSNPGDLWFNTSTGNLFLFTRIDNQTYWVEV